MQYPIREVLWIQIAELQDRKIPFRLYDLYIYLWIFKTLSLSQTM